MAGQHGNVANAEQQATIFNVLVDFWSKITPSVLQLVAHSSVVNFLFFPLLFNFTEHFFLYSADGNGESTLFKSDGSAGRMQIDSPFTFVTPLDASSSSTKFPSTSN